MAVTLIWIIEPGQLFIARGGRSELTITSLSCQTNAGVWRVGPPTAASPSPGRPCRSGLGRASENRTPHLAGGGQGTCAGGGCVGLIARGMSSSVWSRRSLANFSFMSRSARVVTGGSIRNRSYKAKRFRSIMILSAVP